MTEKVGNVQLNYQYYGGTDDYSDGDIENEILEYVKQEKDVSVILSRENRWPVLYHLSPVRKNIVDWYPMEKEASVLEIGSGCGAITGALCEKAKDVTCVELSRKRSLINAYRNRQYSNLEILVGNFNEIQIERKFDYITLIGVLEYAEYYTQGENAYHNFLIKIKEMLKPGGKLLVAIENKFGLKYWSGAREDHTGRFFDSIQGYRRPVSKVRTFSKEELRSLLANSGYEKQIFYYPFPDYKFPTQIFSDEYLPKEADLIGEIESFDSSRLGLFKEMLVYDELVKNGKFDFFANSFFIEAN